MGILVLSFIMKGCIFLAFLGFLSAAHALLPNASTIIDTYKILGFAGLTIDKEGVELAKIHGGVRMAEDDTLIEENDHWQLGETSRLITATLVARLVAQGYVNFTTTMKEAFDIDIDPSFDDFTIADLMTQQAGLPDTPEMLMNEWEFMADLLAESNFDLSFDNTILRHKLVDHFLTKPAKPSNKPKYSFIDWAVLAHMLEMVTGKSYEDLVQQEVFTMLGMEGCGFGPNTLDPSLPPLQPWNHLSGPFGIYNLPITPSNQASSSSALTPSNGINCDIESFRKLITVHLKQDEDYLPMDLWNELHKEQAGGDERFAFGMKLIDGGDLGEIGYAITQVNTQNACSSYADFYIFFDYDMAVTIRINTYIVSGMRPYAGLDYLRSLLIGEGLMTSEKLDLSVLRNLQ